MEPGESATPRNSAAASIEVGGGGSALRDALKSAEAGAVIEVAAGRYEGPLVLRRSVEIHGTGDGGDVIIDASEEGAVVVLEGRRNRVLLSGLTLTGGLSRGGGGVKVPGGAWLTMRDCVIDNCNGGSVGGGGLYGRRGELLLERVQFTGNRGRQGGAALLDGDATVTFNDCSFHNNQATGGGAVAVLDRAKVSLRGCEFSGNLVDGNPLAPGSALWVAPSPRAPAPVLVIDCTIDGSEDAVSGPTASE